MQYEHHKGTFVLINSNFISLQLELGIFFMEGFIRAKACLITRL